MRHTRNNAEEAQNHGNDDQHLFIAQQLPNQLPPQIITGIDATDHNASGNGDYQSWNLRNQGIANTQQGVIVRRRIQRQAMLPNANDQAADQVDEEDEDGGNGVATYEFAGTVHGPEEIRFLSDFLAPLLGLLLIDQAGVEIGIDGHLLARHGVEGKAGTDLGNTPGTLGDDDKIDDDEDGKDDDADGVVPSHHKLPEGLDDHPRGTRPVLPMQQNHPRRRNIEG